MKADYSEIEAFLRNKGYKFSQANHGWHGELNDNVADFYFYGLFENVIKDCLSHWLSCELGRHWQNGVFRAVDYARDERGFYYGFDADAWQDIQKVMAWHNALESEAE